MPSAGLADPRPAPSEFSLRSVMDHDAWGGLVADAVARIGDGVLGKVVLARQVDVTANCREPSGSRPGAASTSWPPR